jgi:hypothetical protein
MGFSNFILVNLCLLLTVEARPKGWAREPRHQLGPGNKSRVGSFIQFFLIFFLSPKASQLQPELVGFKKFCEKKKKEFFGLSPHVPGVASEPGVAVDKESGVGGRWWFSFYFKFFFFGAPPQLYLPAGPRYSHGMRLGPAGRGLVVCFYFYFFYILYF